MMRLTRVAMPHGKRFTSRSLPLLSSSLSSSFRHSRRTFASINSMRKDLQLDESPDEEIVEPDERFMSEKLLPTKPLVESKIMDQPKPSLSERLDKFPEVYTSNSAVADHTEADIGRYYHVGADVRKEMPKGVVSEELLEEMDLTGNYLMVREAGYKIVQRLKKVNKGAEEGKHHRGTSRAVLGMRGRGKTTTLNYAAQYARSQGWLILSMRAYDLYYDVPGFITPHPSREMMWDQPGGTKNFFRRLRDSEAETLMKIKLKKEYPYNWEPKLTGDDVRVADALKPAVPTADQPATLFDMVALGALDDTQTSRMLDDFEYELRNVTEMPVLVTIDDYNRFDNLSEFARVDNPYLKIQNKQLRLCDFALSLGRKAVENGVTLFAPTQGSTMRNMGMHLKGNKASTVQRCNEQEVDNCISHYKVSGKIAATTEEMGKNYRARFRIMSQGIMSEMSFLGGLV